MPAFFQSDDRPGRRSSLARLIWLTLACTLVSISVAFLVRRYLARMGPAGALPAPAPVRQSWAASDAPHGEVGGDLEHLGRVLDDRLEARGETPPSPLAAVAGGLSATRVTELERLLADADVVPGDGSDLCPTGFPIKGNGRSGIYHWPGALAYGITHPTLCFRTTEAADRAGFRPAKR